MESQKTVVITVSRQLGSGGSYLGQRLADRLGFKYLDREILQRAAAQMGEESWAIEHLDENPGSFWDALFQSLVPCSPESYIPPPAHYSDDRAVFAAETLIIRQMAKTQNSVILGRGGFHTLAGYSGTISIFLHAPKWFRLARVMDRYQLKNEKDALAMIEHSDRERSRLVHSMASADWNDLRNYHLSLDTSMAGLDAAEEIILSVVKNSIAFKRVQASSHDLSSMRFIK